VNNEFEGMRKEVVALLNYTSGIGVEGLRKTTKYLNQDRSTILDLGTRWW
jgi:hypothetical protein